MRQAVWVGVVFTVLFWAGVGRACESYEECIGWQKNINHGPSGRTSIKGTPPNQYLVTENEPSEYQVLKAIAYKLAEISEKLDNLPPPDPFRQMAQKAAKKK